MKCIVLKPSHIQGFLCNFKIERDISISLRKKWSWTPCTSIFLMLNRYLPTSSVLKFNSLTFRYHYDSQFLKCTQYEELSAWTFS